jgi:hypothetical protein
VDAQRCVERGPCMADAYRIIGPPPSPDRMVENAFDAQTDQ